MELSPRLKDFLALRINDLHRTVFRLSNGRIANRGMGMPVVMLTTTGRKSGKLRTTMLTSPVQDGDRYVLVASNGGDDRDPAWLLNLQANPTVEVAIDGTTRAMTARVASPDEKAELWPRVVSGYKGYANYQTRTDRDIPLVILTP